MAPDSKIVNEGRNDSSEASSSGSPWYQLRKDATTCVSQTLQRGRRNIWQLTTSRVLVLLSSGAVGSMSIHQFLKNYEGLNMFILAGEAFSGVEAVEFRQMLKGVCENLFCSLPPAEYLYRPEDCPIKDITRLRSVDKTPGNSLSSITAYLNYIYTHRYCT